MSKLSINYKHGPSGKREQNHKSWYTRSTKKLSYPRFLSSFEIFFSFFSKWKSKVSIPVKKFILYKGVWKVSKGFVTVTIKPIGKPSLINCFLKHLAQVDSASSKICVKTFIIKSLTWTVTDKIFFETFLQNFKWEPAFSKNCLKDWSRLENFKQIY